MGVRVEAAKTLPRDLTHPYVHVKYEADNHTHIVSGCSMEPGESYGEFLEDVASELSEAVLRCNEARHKGHGRQHMHSHAEEAFKEAVRQLQEVNFYQEFIDIQRKIEHYEIWGGPVPALVFQPNPESMREWQMFVTHPETGLPSVYPISEKVLDIPPPNPKKVRRGKLGWYRKGRSQRGYEVRNNR